MAAPAHNRRLAVDERRRQLLAVGEQLFLERSYAALSMAAIARAAGVSKPLLYHYFPSKQAYFTAAFATLAEDLRARVEPDLSLAPHDALERSLDAYLGWVQEHSSAYAKLIRTADQAPEIYALVDGVRRRAAQRLLEVLGGGSPRARTVINGWLGFIDGVCLDWIENGDLDRDEVKQIILWTLLAALQSGPREA